MSLILNHPLFFLCVYVYVLGTIVAFLLHVNFEAMMPLYNCAYELFKQVIKLYVFYHLFGITGNLTLLILLQWLFMYFLVGNG